MQKEPFNAAVSESENPTGFCLSREELSSISWTKKESIVLVVDESFSDFSDVATLFDQSLFRSEPSLGRD